MGPDEEAAAALDRAAMIAAGRTGYAAAASALERAGAIGSEGTARAARRLGAAQMAMAAGRSQWSLSLLEGEAADDPVTRADAAHLRGILLMLTGNLDGAYDLLLREGARAAETHPADGAAMLADAVLTRTMGVHCRQALDTARRAYAIGGAQPAASPSLIGYLAGALVLRGDARQARPLLERFDALTADIDPVSPEGQMLVISAGWRTWIGDFEQTSARLDLWLELGRSAGAATFVALLLAWAIEIDFRMGRWARARARGEEAISLLTETGQLAPVGYAMCNLAWVEAGLGLADAAAAHALAAREGGRRHGVGSVEMYSGAVLGFLALGQGDPESAVRELAPQGAYASEFGLAEPATVPWQPDLVEAYARLDSAWRRGAPWRPCRSRHTEPAEPGRER